MRNPRLFEKSKLDHKRHQQAWYFQKRAFLQIFTPLALGLCAMGILLSERFYSFWWDLQQMIENWKLELQQSLLE